MLLAALSRGLSEVVRIGSLLSSSLGSLSCNVGVVVEPAVFGSVDAPTCNAEPCDAAWARLVLLELCWRKEPVALLAALQGRCGLLVVCEKLRGHDWLTDFFTLDRRLPCGSDRLFISLPKPVLWLVTTGTRTLSGCNYGLRRAAEAHDATSKMVDTRARDREALPPCSGVACESGPARDLDRRLPVGPSHAAGRVRSQVSHRRRPRARCCS